MAHWTRRSSGLHGLLFLASRSRIESDAAHGCADSDLFDHLVGTRQQCRGNFESERLRGLQVDDELELRRLLHRQVTGLLALENARRVDAAEAKRVRKDRSVTHETAS